MGSTTIFFEDECVKDIFGEIVVVKCSIPELKRLIKTLEGEIKDYERQVNTNK